ncbi:MAG: hypothetical protein JO108_32130 [Acidobacteriaceae bacterium]|nr:hypothetical protein [Acidobacteriaceae bacterium]
MMSVKFWKRFFQFPGHPESLAVLEPRTKAVQLDTVNIAAIHFDKMPGPLRVLLRADAVFIPQRPQIMNSQMKKPRPKKTVHSNETVTLRASNTRTLSGASMSS